MKRKKPAPASYAQKYEPYNPPKFAKTAIEKYPKLVATKLDMVKVLGPAPRTVNTEGVVIKSVPMGGPGGTIPIDPDLQAAKDALAWRTGPLYNKGGPQYIGDEDMNAVKSGATRRRN